MSGDQETTQLLLMGLLGLGGYALYQQQNKTTDDSDGSGGSSTSSSSSSSEGLRRRNVSSSVDKMKRIINDDLDDPIESPIKASDLTPNDISFPLGGSEDYFSDFTSMKREVYKATIGIFFIIFF